MAAMGCWSTVCHIPYMHTAGISGGVLNFGVFPENH